jgi:predicted DNA-binding protein
VTLKKSPPKVRTTFRLTKETVSKLHKLTKVLNLTQSQIMEIMIEQSYIEAKKEYPLEFQNFLRI